jgi:HlyD family secretion protein
MTVADQATSPFRQTASRQLDRPEQLATSLRLVTPGYFAATAALIMLVAGTFAAAALVKVPLTIPGTGVIISSKGVLEIPVSADYDGRIVEMLVDVGQRVSPGQKIARIIQPSLENDLKLARADLELTLDETERVRSLQESVAALSEEVGRQKEQTALESIRLLEARFGLLGRLAEQQAQMRKEGSTTIDRYLQVQSDLTEVQEQLASKRGELINQRLARGEQQGQFARELQALETRRAQAAGQIDRLEERVRNETTVRSTQHGIVSEVKALPGDLIRFNTVLVSLLPVDESFQDLRPGATQLVAAVLISAKDGKKIQPGMRVLINPSSVRRDVYGAIEGRVVEASDVPASADQMQKMLRNDDLVRKLTQGGPPFVVMVQMARDAGTPSGFVWTSSRGPNAALTTGTLLDADVETERVPAISLIIPELKELLRSLGKQAREAG